MSWLRIDDGFTSHPKFAGWTTNQRWIWLEIMGYCARYRTEGIVPADLSLLPRGVTRNLLKLAENSGWIDLDADGTMRIHDWDRYNPKDTGAERSRRWRNKRERHAQRNGDVTQDALERHADVTSRAGARARSRPVPSLEPYIPPEEGLLETSVECNVCAALVPLGAMCPDCGATPRAAGSNPRAVTKERSREAKSNREAELRRRLPEIEWHGDSSDWADRVDQLERDVGARLPALERERLLDSLINQ